MKKILKIGLAVMVIGVFCMFSPSSADPSGHSVVETGANPASSMDQKGNCAVVGVPTVGLVGRAEMGTQDFSGNCDGVPFNCVKGTASSP